MKKVILTLNLFIFLALNAIGQAKSEKADIVWGPEKKSFKNVTLSDVVGYDETGIYALKQTKGLFGLGATLFLEHYDQKMTLSKSVEFELKQQKEERDYEFILYLNHEMYLFSSITNKATKKNTLFVQGINKSNLQPDQELRKVAAIDYAGNSRYNSGRFDFELSNDSSKVLIYYSLPYDKGESKKFGFHVLDDRMNPLWEKQVTLPYLEELFDVEDYEVDNEGNVHLLGLIFKEKRKEKRKGTPNYTYQILSYLNSGNRLREYPVKIEGKFLTDMQITINQDQDIICGGFYSTEGTFSIKGSYFLKIDGETKRIKSKEFQEFRVDFIMQNLSEREERKTKKKAARKGKEPELYQYSLNDIILKDDGGALLVGEQYFIRTSTTSTYYANGGGGGTTTTYWYYYNDIIVINISPEGKIEWTEKIAKKQITADDGGFYSSYALTVVGDKLYFVFNDNPKNLFYRGEGKLYNFKKNREALVVLVTLDRNGRQTREALFSSKQADILTRPKVCEQISKNEMVLFGQKRWKQRFAKVSFKE
jgi:hypothetical protein